MNNMPDMKETEMKIALMNAALTQLKWEVVGLGIETLKTEIEAQKLNNAVRKLGDKFNDW